MLSVTVVPLIEMTILGVRQRYCTYGEVSYNGHTWLKLDGNQPIVRSGNGGVKTAAVYIPDFSLALGRALITMGADKVFGANSSVKIYDGIGVTAGVVDTARLVFSGFVDQVAEIGPLLTLNLRSVGALNDFFPKARISRPEWKFLIEDGTVERWGGVVYTFRSQNG